MAVQARMTKTSSQVVTRGTNVKVALNIVSFNSGCTCSTTNNRITPGAAGYYQVNAQVCLNTPAYKGYAYIMLYKNGSLLSAGDQTHFYEDYSLDPILRCNVGDLVYFNGTTDYIEVFVYSNTDSSVFPTAADNYLTIQGTSGPQGESGYSGYSGAPFVGYSGYSGQYGISGYSGFSSYSGISGYSGTRGYSGYSGLSGLADDTLFNREIDLGSGGDVTVNWTSGYKQFFTLIGKSCIEFVPPTTVPGWTADLTLRIYDTEGVGKSVYWPTNIKWEQLGDHTGALSYFPGVGYFYLFRFYWDGASSGYLGWYHGPFRPNTSTGCTCP